MSSSAHPPPPPDPTTTPSRTNTSTKKPTPLPWSHEETISLIESYRDKWYSLNKGHLKASQWDEVAQAVPSKTPVQCRHKIEKLRKRYRSELQKPFPYTWQYFQIMHQMEQGPLNPTPINALPRDPNTSLNYGVNVYTNGVGSSNFKKRVVHDSEDEEWSGSKTRSIKNMGGTRGNGGGGVVRNLRNRKRKAYYNDVIVDDESSDDDEEEDMDVTYKYSGTNKYGDDDEDIEVELAGEIKGFAERFLMMENGKIEMMRESERLRMEMERKKMDMIVQAQRKIVHTIGKVFASAEKDE